jgi:hypothetical protein
MWNTKSAEEETQKTQRNIIDSFGLFVFLLLRFLCSPAASSVPNFEQVIKTLTGAAS